MRVYKTTTSRDAFLNRKDAKKNNERKTILKKDKVLLPFPCFLYMD